MGLGTAGIAVELRNGSRTVCTLDGSPKLQLLGANGTPMRSIRSPVSMVSWPRARLVSLAPGALAFFAISFADGTGFTYACPISTRGLLTPPHDQTPIRVSWRLAPYGGGKGLPACGVVAISSVASKDTGTQPPSPWRKATLDLRVG